MTSSRMRSETLSAEYSITGWLNVDELSRPVDGALVVWFDKLSRRGTTLRTVSGGGGYSSQGSSVRLSFGIDSGTTPSWESCGMPNPDSRYVSNSLTAWNGSVYAATTDAKERNSCARVYRYVGGRSWEDLGTPPGVDAHGIGPMIVYADELYVAPWTYDWTVVNDIPLSAVHVYRLTRGHEWQDCGQPGACRRIYGLAVFRGELYAAGDDNAIHVRRADGIWSVAVRLPTYAHPLHVYGDRLWAGTVDPGRLWSFDGAEWRDEGNPEADENEASQLHSFAIVDGGLAVGSWPKGIVDLRDQISGQWMSLGAPVEATEINALQTYNGMLYAGALPYAEVARFDGIQGWSSVRRFKPAEGWQAASVADSGWRSRQDMEAAGGQSNDDQAMREWSRVTSMIEYDGKLFVSTGNCTSAYWDTPRSSLGTVYAMSTGTVVTSPSELFPGYHHVAAVRDGATIRLYVDGNCVAARTGNVGEAIVLPDGTSRRGVGLVNEQWHDRAIADADVAAMIAAGPGSSGSAAMTR
jgi:hypothetical protein